VPSYDYGMEPAAPNGSTAPNASVNGQANASALAAVIAAAIASLNNQPNTQAKGNPAPNTNTNANANANGNGCSWPQGPAWKCSDKQRDLILKLVDEHQLDKGGVEALAIERFGKGVRLLNKIEASGLIDELLEAHGNNQGRGQGQGNARRRNGNGNGNAYNTGRKTAA